MKAALWMPDVEFRGRDYNGKGWDIVKFIDKAEPAAREHQQNRSAITINRPGLPGMLLALFILDPRNWTTR